MILAPFERGDSPRSNGAKIIENRWVARLWNFDYQSTKNSKFKVQSTRGGVEF